MKQISESAWVCVLTSTTPSGPTTVHPWLMSESLAESLSDMAVPIQCFFSFSYLPAHNFHKNKISLLHHYYFIFFNLYISYICRKILWQRGKGSDGGKNKISVNSAHLSKSFHQPSDNNDSGGGQSHREVHEWGQ